MIVFLAATIFVAQSANPDAPQEPTQACLEVLADAEGEMTLAQDAGWRRKAMGELAEMRAANDRRLSRIDAALAKNRKARDRLQRKFDRNAIEEDDFNAARSEIEMDTRRLMAERDTPRFPVCGF